MPLAARFFDDVRYLRTVAAENPPAKSAAEAHGAARLAGCRPGALILDAACGNGRHAVPLARSGYRVVGLDSPGDLLAAARRPPGAPSGLTSRAALTRSFRSSRRPSMRCCAWAARLGITAMRVTALRYVSSEPRSRPAGVW